MLTISPRIVRPRARIAFLITLALLLRPALLGQSAAVGTIEGRVFNPGTGEYVELARVIIEGTALEAFTDSAGQYRITHVPVGEARVKATHTGTETPVRTVTVPAGGTVQQDFSLSRAQRSAGSEGAIKLEDFVVSTSREMEGAAIAINEQRFAPNMKAVASTDEFGGIADGNVAEFMKNFPGVTVGYSGGNAREIQIDGVPAANVPVSISGFSLASAGQAVTSRTVALDMVSINNMARIEVEYSPTPESQGSALAGSVNMVPRSSIERARPVFNWNAFLMMRDDAIEFHHTPGPREFGTRKVHPGWEFSAVVPVNKRFGFTLSASDSTNYSSLDFAQTFWRGTGLATNGAAFPHTTPDQPYMTQYTIRDGAKYTTRRSLGVTFDYQLARNDRLTLALQMSTFDAEWMFRNLNFIINRVNPGDFTPTSTHSAPGQGTLTRVNAGNNRTHRTYMPTLTWRHDGPVWKMEAGAGYSRAINHNRGTDFGAFRNSTATRAGVTIAFDDIFYLRPGSISVTDAAGNTPVDPYRLDNYAMTLVNDTQNDSDDIRRTLYGNVRRSFYGRVPVTLKAGFDVRDAIRDLRADRTLPYNYVGPDGRTSNTPAAGDDVATPFLDASYSQRTAPFGFPKIEWISNERLWDHFVANPSHFALNENAQYRSLIAPNKRAEELISAAYLRSDIHLLERRLKVVGGLRVEQTNIEAYGPLTDPTRNFQRNAQGQPILGPNGRPLLITSDPLGMSQLTFISRGTKAEKEYFRYFPSLNVSYNLRENLIARAAHYWSVGRPDFNQYAGGITLPDLGLAPAQNNRITVNNAGIKAWSAKTTNVRLEYYFERVGQVSLTGFVRDFEDFFGGTAFPVTPEFLALYDLDPEMYSGYDVSTQHNVQGTVRMTGVSLSYRQALTFLPHWARGVQVFANGSAQRATGPTLGSFTGAFFAPRSGSWGISLTRPKYNVRMNWSYRGRVRRGAIAAGNSIEPGTYTWGSKYLYIDLQGEYHLRKGFAVFANLRNLHDTPDDVEIAGPSTPAHAQFRQRERFGALWTFGLKGSF